MYLDLRGHGRSEWRDSDTFSFEACADDIAAFCDIVGIAGPIVLQTADLQFNEEPSFRFTGCLQVGPGGNVEFTYYGLFQFDSGAFVRRSGDNDLFSVFSNFGTLPFGGFAETDMSDFQRIDYSSTFDSFEINYRQRWMSPNCRYQGSWLCGVRPGDGASARRLRGARVRG